MVIESLHEYKFGSYEIRFWQHEDTIQKSYANSSREAVLSWYNSVTFEPSLDGLAEYLTTLPYCNAVQVRDTRGGAALLIYPEWP